MTDPHTASTSESENPAIDAPEPASDRRPRTNKDWWPDQLDLSVLHAHGPHATPLDDDFDYAEAVAALDVEAVKADLVALMTDSQDWWPADYGHYGPLFIRLSWHAAGTYRIEDGRGGAGGHTFGKAHGAGNPDLVGPEPEGCPVHGMGLGWKSEYGSGKGGDTITSGIEGAWTPTPIQWDSSYFDTLFGYEWELTKSPAGAKQWRPAGGAGDDTVPDAADPSKRHAPMMTTADLALRFDPAYEAISRRFHENPEEFRLAFAKAWYKLLHRDMGPVTRYLGPWVPEAQLWQDPVPAVDHPLVDEDDVAALKAEILGSGLTVAQLVSTAWASASTFRGTDLRGGANGARIRLAPQKDWAVNVAAGVGDVVSVLEGIQERFNASASGGKRISLADLIVLAGCVGVGEAAKTAGFDVKVPFTPGRTDATQEQTDVDSFAVLEPRADAFRNWFEAGDKLPAEVRLLDKANLLTLTAPEMTVLVGGLRALGANVGGSPTGVLTDRPGVLSNDVFVNLLGMATEWSTSASAEGVYEGKDRASGEVRWTATAADLVFGSNSQLRALAEVYASADGAEKFARDFVAAWDKVMMLDRFDVA